MNQCKPSELKEYALQVLLGTSLEDKLTPPSPTILAGTSEPFAPVPFPTPALPGRPPGLELSRSPKKRQTHQFPGKNELGRDRARGHVLHFFANHELLALEIMALAILKFSDAPVGFIRGIVQTMADEQRHMHKYLERMTELGVSFGDVTLNGFFWQSLKDMRGPQEYAAAMSLTFEQANLDFSFFFEQDFRRLGDERTAAILTEVRMDEIGHVKHGAIWLDRWRNPAKSLWDEYRSHLRYPMTPARGKGPVFDRESRKLAGLNEDFINQVEVFSHSRGRPPNIFWFNPSCEQEVGAQSHASNMPRHFTELTEDLAVLMMHLGHSDDVVLVHKEPSLPWLKSMKQAGFEIPEFVAGAAQPQKALGERHIGGLKPWGWSPSARHSLKPLAENFVSGVVAPPYDSWLTQDSGTNIFSKALAATLRTEHDLKAAICTSIEEINRVLMSTSGCGQAVIKAPIGSSGHNAVRVNAGTPLDPKYASWCSKILSSQKCVVVEPWVDRLADLSCQFEISPRGEVSVLGFTRFIVNTHGTYKGHLFGRLLEGLPANLHARWHHTWSSLFDDAAKRCGRKLFELGYHGPAGIDGFLYRTANGETKFQSLGEINPRYTMGRVALEMSKHLISKQPGVWLHVSKKEAQSLGFETFAALAAHIERVAPPKIRNHSSGSIQLEEGALFTNDPAEARQVLTVLWADTSLEQVQILLNRPTC